MFSSIQNIITRCKTTNAANDANKYQQQQIESFGIAQMAQVVYPYGYNASAPVNCDCIGFNIMAAAENKIIIPQDSISRIKKLEPTEVAIGNPHKQSFIKFDKDGNILIQASADQTINISGNCSINVAGAASILASSDCTINGSSIKLGTDASMGAARIGDQVKLIIAGTEHIGEIISGSTKTLIE